ncbi:MAG: lipase family protein [Sphaerospermopsis kisseleviana]
MTVNYSKAVKMAVCCQEIYQDFSKIAFSSWTEKPILISDKTTDTQLAILADSSAVTIVFRGTESRMDWRYNFDTGKIGKDIDLQKKNKEFDEKIIQQQIVAKTEQIYPYKKGNNPGPLMHSGFSNAYLSVRDQIHQYIKDNQTANIIVTGHSLGGALATLCGVDIQYNFHPQLSSLEVYTFGSPKVGNKKFCQSYNRRVPNTYRFIYGMDIVPALPRWWQGRYSHVGQQLRLGPWFSYNFISARVKDHDIRNYIRLLEKTLN